VQRNIKMWLSQLWSTFQKLMENEHREQKIGRSFIFYSPDWPPLPSRHWHQRITTLIAQVRTRLRQI